MGKVPTSKRQRHDPLPIQLREDSLGDGLLSAPGRRSKPRRGDENEETAEDRISKRIIDIAQEQQREMSEQQRPPRTAKGKAPAVDRTAPRAVDSDEMSDEEDEAHFSDDDEEEVAIEVDEGDQATLDAFMRPNPGAQRNLADLIMQRIKEKEAGNGMNTDDGGADDAMDRTMDPKVIDVYTKIGGLLSRYKSGPLPKAFKILPSLPQWPDLILLCEPDKWTPHATYAATRIFASNLNPKESQRFYETVLLDRVRDDIQEHAKLSPHLYQALKKAMYKPQAFFKGVLFPLCESGTCTLREATIVGSVLSKVSIPVLHSGAAILKLAEMDYSGPNSLFIRVLLDKKHALPYKVVDAVVIHFIRFKHDHRAMPVLWHQSLLVFVQRYKQDLAEEQRDALLDLVKVKYHAQITAEVRRELSDTTTMRV